MSSGKLRNCIAIIKNLDKYKNTFNMLCIFDVVRDFSDPKLYKDTARAGNREIRKKTCIVGITSIIGVYIYRGENRKPYLSLSHPTSTAESICRKADAFCYIAMLNAF